MTLQEASTESEKNLNSVIKLDQARIQGHLDQMVRGTVEETLNAMLNYVMPGGMSEAKVIPTPGLGIMQGR